MRSDCDNGDVFELFVLADQLGGREAVHEWQREVHEDDIRWVANGALDRHLPVLSLEYDEPVIFELASNMIVTVFLSAPFI